MQLNSLEPMTESEIPLIGGQVNSVVRVGDTVRRTIARDMSLQHELLAHLAHKGLDASPRFLGYDTKGRQILTYLPGEVYYDKDDFSDAQLASAARLLRAYHDATTNFPPVIAASAEVFCHNDWTPANTVFTSDMPTGIIDFDTATPGTRLWDVTYSAWMWLSLGEDRWTPSDQRRRLLHFVSAYDHTSCSAGLVAACLPGRQAGRMLYAEQRGMDAAVHWARHCLSWTVTHITNVYQPDGLL
jgi:hypothetical protein